MDLSGRAAELADYLDDLAAEVAPYEPGRLRVATTREYLVAANWKLVVENYHECYHCPSIHPELCRVTPPDSGANFRPAGAWVGGSMQLRPHATTMSLDGRSGGVPLPGLDEARRRRVLYAGIFPNLLISCTPRLRAHSPAASDRRRSHSRRLRMAVPLRGDRPRWLRPAYAVDFWDVTNRQDWRACESVQRGMASRWHTPGPLTAAEDAVHQFIGLVGTAYLTGRAPGGPAGRET